MWALNNIKICQNLERNGNENENFECLFMP